jgi:hypothetical protein
MGGTPSFLSGEFCSFMRCTGGFVLGYCFIFMNEDYPFLKKKKKKKRLPFSQKKKKKKYIYFLIKKVSCGD